MSELVWSLRGALGNATSQDCLGTSSCHCLLIAIWMMTNWESIRAAMAYLSSMLYIYIYYFLTLRCWFSIVLRECLTWKFKLNTKLARKLCCVLKTKQYKQMKTNDITVTDSASTRVVYLTNATVLTCKCGGPQGN